MAYDKLDLEGRVLWWSKGAEHIFGHTSGQIVGKPADILFPADDQAARVPEWEVQVASRDGPAEDDDPVPEQARVDVESALAVAAFVLDDGRDVGHRGRS